MGRSRPVAGSVICSPRGGAASPPTAGGEALAPPGFPARSRSDLRSGRCHPCTSAPAWRDARENRNARAVGFRGEAPRGNCFAFQLRGGGGGAPPAPPIGSAQTSLLCIISELRALARPLQAGKQLA